MSFGPFRNEGQEGSTRNTFRVSLGGASWRFACWVAQATRCDWAWWLVVWRCMMMIFCESKRRWRVHCLILSRAELVSFKLFWTMMLQGQHCKRCGVKVSNRETPQIHCKKKLFLSVSIELIKVHQMEISRGCQAAIKRGWSQGTYRKTFRTLPNEPKPPGRWKIVNSLDLSPRCWWWTSGWTSFHGSKFSQ